MFLHVTEGEEAHPVTPLKRVPSLLQQINNQLGGQEGLSMGVKAGAQWKVGALSDALLELLNTKVKTKKRLAF